MATVQKYGADARAALLSGVEQLNKAVCVTLGPGGHNVLFRHMGALISTKDGVTVAREINLPGVFESIGADLIKGAAGQTVDEAGDGTTTATLLAYRIFEAGCEAIEDGAEPTQLVRGIEKARTAIVGDYDAKGKKFKGGILERFTVPCSPELAYQAARISANGDDAIADVVSRAVLQVGVDGALTIGNSNSQDHVLEVAEGMQVQSGMTHPYFVTDPQRNRCAYDDVTVLLVNRRISTGEEARNILTSGIKTAQAKGRAVALLVLCDDIDPEALGVFIQNKVKQDGTPPIASVVVRTPLWGEARRDLLEDIGMLVEAKRIENPKGKSFESLTASDWGFAQRVVINGVGDAGKMVITAAPMSDFRRTEKFEPYLAQIKAIIANEDQRPDQIDVAKGRYAALTGGVAVIKVGGTSANSVTEIKFRVEDAIHATRAAVSDGVVPGGGSALLYAKELFMGSTPCDPTETKDEARGMDLLASILDIPAGQIASNAGYKADEVIANIREYAEGQGSFVGGFDASTGQYIPNMIAHGIVDPLRVVRAALNAAVSAAATTLLRCECVIGFDATTK